MSAAPPQDTTGLVPPAQSQNAHAAHAALPAPDALPATAFIPDLKYMMYDISRKVGMGTPGVPIMGTYCVLRHPQFAGHKPSSFQYERFDNNATTKYPMFTCSPRRVANIAATVEGHLEFAQVNLMRAWHIAIPWWQWQ